MDYSSRKKIVKKDKPYRLTVDFKPKKCQCGASLEFIKTEFEYSICNLCGRHNNTIKITTGGFLVGAGLLIGLGISRLFKNS